MNKMCWVLMVWLFAADTVLFAENELHKLMDKFCIVCTRRKL